LLSDNSIDFSFNKHLRPACLWHHRRIPTSTAVASGWGLTAVDSETGAEDLLKVTLNIYDNAECAARYPAELNRKLPRGIVNSQLCAGYLAGGKDTCQGDSGELSQYM
jgi:secreted trypsin-like serine protease